MSNTTATHDTATEPARTARELIRARLAGAAEAFGSTLRDPNLRRAQLAFGAIWGSEWAFMVALSVVAFREGGAAAVAVVTTLRMVPSALLAPFGAVLADRLPRDRILVAAGLIRALITGAAAVTLAANAPAAIVFGLAVLATAAFTVVRPAHSALLPALCHTPGQLTSAAVVRGLMDSVGTLVGPALAAVGLALSGPEAVFGLVAAASAWSAVLVARISYDPLPRTVEPRRRIARDAAAGVAALVRHRDASLIMGIALVQTFTRGCVGVLTVIVAVELLQSGDAGVGVLTAAIGAGAVVGSLGAGLLAGSRALARWEGVGVALWGLPLLACAAFPQQAPVLAFFAAIGVGNALVDVGLFTLPARIIPEGMLGRVYGAFESVATLSVALGALAAPLLVAAFGVRGALIAGGALGPAAVAAAWPRLRGIDGRIVGRDDEIRLLRQVPMLRLLPLPTIEQLAAGVDRAEVASGASVFAQGDHGDRFYVIEAGRAEVRRNGRVVSVLGPGDGFGEIALLRDSPRTATITACGRLSLRSVYRGDFLGAVTGHAPAAAEADTTVGRLLGAYPDDSEPPSCAPSAAAIAR